MVPESSPSLFPNHVKCKSRRGRAGKRVKLLLPLFFFLAIILAFVNEAKIYPGSLQCLKKSVFTPRPRHDFPDRNLLFSNYNQITINNKHPWVVLHWEVSYLSSSEISFHEVQILSLQDVSLAKGPCSPIYEARPICVVGLHPRTTCKQDKIKAF